MDWKLLTTAAQLQEIKEKSASKVQVIFKHSTRCGTSAMVKTRIERSAAPSDIDFYFLDLISYRNISNLIEQEFMIRHESPQVLLISKGECVYNESHYGIRMEDIVAEAGSKANNK
ncbi:MAG: bacillithiol system redox-active protein YtxJ [Gemmatimonadaceae bacterium]|nr:bacillithiol system redox-active protein YtxJ [Chitinophagaceae bacterium]